MHLVFCVLCIDGGWWMCFASKLITKLIELKFAYIDLYESLAICADHWSIDCIGGPFVPFYLLYVESSKRWWWKTGRRDRERGKNENKYEMKVNYECFWWFNEPNDLCHLIATYLTIYLCMRGGIWYFDCRKQTTCNDCFRWIKKLKNHRKNNCYYSLIILNFGPDRRQIHIWTLDAILLLQSSKFSFKILDGQKRHSFAGWIHIISFDLTALCMKHSHLT